MRAKTLFLILALSFLRIGIAFPQSISIELSVRWKKGFDVFDENSVLYFPELVIMYRNSSDSSFYFKKISDSHCGFPILPYGRLIQYPLDEYLNPNYLKRARSHYDFVNQNYHVEIGGANSFVEGWIAMNDTANQPEQMIDMVNGELADIYKYLLQKEINTCSDSSVQTKMYFSLIDITPEKIIQDFKDKFIFLKGGETYDDTYNLIGFQVVRGCFTFSVKPDALKDDVKIEPYWDKENEKWEFKQVQLPEKVGAYLLYSGNFNTNDVTITFSDEN
jgi:hypothetical protein